jgi:hypothetical protein
MGDYKMWDKNLILIHQVGIPVILRRKIFSKMSLIKY